jgi:hypothetical protein
MNVFVCACVTVCLSVCARVCVCSACLTTCLFVCLSIYACHCVRLFAFVQSPNPFQTCHSSHQTVCARVRAYVRTRACTCAFCFSACQSVCLSLYACHCVRLRACSVPKPFNTRHSRHQAVRGLTQGSSNPAIKPLSPYRHDPIPQSVIEQNRASLSVYCKTLPDPGLIKCHLRKFKRGERVSIIQRT